MVQGLLGLSSALEKRPAFVLGNVVTNVDYGWGVVVAVQPELLAYGVFLHGYNGGHTIDGRLPTASGKWFSEGALKLYEPVRSEGISPLTSAGIEAIGEWLAANGGQGAAGGEAKGRKKHTKSATRALPRGAASVLGDGGTNAGASVVYSGRG